jgi:hypothetical protein
VYHPKPAYRAAKALTGFLGGCRFAGRLDVGGADDYVLVFSRGDDLRLAVWTTAAEPRPLTVPADPGGFHGIDHLGRELPDLTAGAGGLAVTATDAPQYLAPDGVNVRLREAAKGDGK